MTATRQVEVTRTQCPLERSDHFRGEAPVKATRASTTAGTPVPLCLVRNLQRASAIAAKSGNCSRLTGDLPPKDLTRKVSRCLLVIQALATYLSVVQP